MCYAAPVAPPELGKKKSRHSSKRWCTACGTIAAELHDALTQRDPEDEWYLSEKHVTEVIPLACSNLPRRFPQVRSCCVTLF